MERFPGGAVSVGALEVCTNNTKFVSSGALTCGIQASSYVGLLAVNCGLVAVVLRVDEDVEEGDFVVHVEFICEIQDRGRFHSLL